MLNAYDPFGAEPLPAGGVSVLGVTFSSVHEVMVAILVTTRMRI